MRRHDRLAHLAACSNVLCQYGIRSLSEYRAATAERLASLHRYGPTIRELVAAGNADVMLALWPPPGISWEVARLSLCPADRLLSVTRGTPGKVDEWLVKLTYDVTNVDAERRAWLTVRDALRGA
jgi:hypothetical protein